MFEDTMLRYEQESCFTPRISEGKGKHSFLNDMREEFSKIPVLSNLDLDPEEIYSIRKTRYEV